MKSDENIVMVIALNSVFPLGNFPKEKEVIMFEVTIQLLVNRDSQTEAEFLALEIIDDITSSEFFGSDIVSCEIDAVKEVD